MEDTHLGGPAKFGTPVEPRKALEYSSDVDSSIRRGRKMKVSVSARCNHVWVVLIVVLATACYVWGGSPLGGTVKSSTGGALAGIPVRAHLEKSNTTVSVYTNSRGEYSYPELSLSPGLYSVAIQMAEFEPVKKAVELVAGKEGRLDFALHSRKPSPRDVTISEIVTALPGSDEVKLSLTQCGNCHSLEFALLNRRRDREQWAQTIAKMGMMGAIGVVGAQARGGRSSWNKPGTKFFTGTPEKRAQLADYLALLEGPASGKIPIKLRPRPTADASTRIVVTEYEVPRGGDPTMLRGDLRVGWPHDVLVDPNGKYVWYDDHFIDLVGRLDKKTGETKEFRYSRKPGSRTGYGIRFDHKGNILVRGARFDPRTEQFTPRSGGIEVDPAGNYWSTGGGLTKVDAKSDKVTRYPYPTDDGTYGMGVDSQGRVYYDVFHGGRVGRWDPKTQKLTEFPTPTPASGPRRGQMDAQDRWWFAEFFAGSIAMFDGKTDVIKEWPIVGPNAAPFTAPFVAPYMVAFDDKNNVAWTTDFNNNRLYRFDVKTETFTEFMMPEPHVEIRHLVVDSSTDPPTLWFPDYRPPGKIVKLQAFN